MFLVGLYPHRYFFFAIGGRGCFGFVVWYDPYLVWRLMNEGGVFYCNKALPLPLPLAIVSLLLAARALALVPLTTGAPLPLVAAVAVSLPPFPRPAGVRVEDTEGGAGVILDREDVVVRGVGGFSTKEVSVVLSEMSANEARRQQSKRKGGESYKKVASTSPLPNPPPMGGFKPVGAAFPLFAPDA